MLPRFSICAGRYFDAPVRDVAATSSAMRCVRGIAFLLLPLVLSTSTKVSADLIVDLTTLENASGGSFLDVADSDSGDLFRLTTDAVGPSGVLNFTNGEGLAVAADGADDNQSFDDGESWTFSWDKATSLGTIGFAGITRNFQHFLVSSSAWIGKNINPGHADVTFLAGSGTLRFTGNGVFSGADLNDGGSDSLLLAADQKLSIAYDYATTGLDSSIHRRITALSFASAAVPEPSGVLALILAAAPFVRRFRSFCAG